MSDYTLSYTGEEVNGLLNTVNSNHAAWDSISQSADHVVEQGTSGDWEYIKFANGLAICSLHMQETDTNYTTYNSMYGYYTKTVSFPFEFIEEPGIGYGGYIGSGFAINARVVGTTTNVYFYYLASSSGSQTIETHAIVMGRWK